MAQRSSRNLTPAAARSTSLAYAASLALVFLLAVFVREQVWIACGGAAPSYLDWAQRHYFGGISRVYVQTADALARGEPYTIVAYPPGYPFFLSLLVRGGLTLQQMRVVQFALDATVVFVIAALLRSIGASRAWAVAGAYAYAAHPLWATGSVYLLAEAFSPAIVATLLWSLSWSRRQVTAAAAVPGAIAGVGAMLRPDFLLLALAGLVWFALVDERPDRLRAAAVFALVIGSLLLLWGVHNRRVHGTWMFGTTASGAGLWEGLGELPNDYGYVLDDNRAAQFAAAHGFGWGSPGASAYFTQEYLKAVRAHPGYVARVVANRWKQIVFDSDPGVNVFFARARMIVDAVGVVWLAAALIVFRRRRDLVFVAAVPLLFALFSIGLVHYEARYVRYAQLSYLVAAVAWLEWLWTRAEERAGARTQVMAAVIVACVTIYSARELVELHRFARTFPSPMAWID